jgi:hypothetical protein
MINFLVINCFKLIVWWRGIKILPLNQPKLEADMKAIYDQHGFVFPNELQPFVDKYKQGTISFIAYIQNQPAGIVRLGNPNVVNRPYELYGMDKTGESYEIQSLVVCPPFRSGSQLVMLSLLNAIYQHALVNNIQSWCAASRRDVYLTMRKFNPTIQLVDIDFKNIQHPLTQYLVKHKIIERYYRMDVDGFNPSQILTLLIKKLLRDFGFRIKRIFSD